ncbi:MAG: hypothetical protein COW25_01685 [Candidatus Nealsonbacteria bacterium CG15_BIG_FIL_POST_REV_8_21_14_020_37_12]|uniref:Uncharacterized protein n=1 Tax=Candidatus Nealsonbacteria bacterium CG15_BIG_FIL_POST_REV_8_21_14_020_37_12 TaxID=1974716 RepID=A0A2M7H1C5_9BACT|nr:MAG: hypothetical protein COW25_01685 [Candidatus Nealsonbacteria bacterium CG15_BIG_FIL_POST_REV_8_21_14_020_37_12]
MEDFLKKISQIFNFTKNPRIKFLSVFLIVISFVGETPLREISHFWANGILSLIGRDISGAGNIIDKLFSIGAPIMIVYIPVTIALWIIIRNGFQKLDWISAPILIGILIKGGVYGIMSLNHKINEFWELAQYGVPGFLLWAFISIFLLSSLVGFAIWFKEIR